MKPSKLQATRKPPPLSVEEELAELLADPTLKPSISFLGLREFPASPRPATKTVADTDSVSPTETVPDTESVSGTQPQQNTKKRILLNTLTPLEAVTPTNSRWGTKTSAGSVPATYSVAGTDSVPGTDPVSPTDPGPGLLKSISARYQKPKPRQAIRVEDGHSHIEQHVYEVLWQTASPYNEQARMITIGFGMMSSLMRLSLNNCRLNVRSLIRKLAIEELREELCQQGVGKTYLIYAPDVILQRRHQAGLGWVIRTRGVAFVHPTTGKPIE
jgi:hypothetical protein